MFCLSSAINRFSAHKMSQPKVLIFDIETSPLIVYTWGTRDQNISLNQIKEDWGVIAWAAKWLGDPASKTIYRDQRKAKTLTDDKAILQALWHLLDEADIVITQNGTKFDSRKLNARFILHGMTPPSPYRHLDTYQILSRVADFTSDKLEYYTDKICTKYKKLKHKKFPGMELWNQCLAGNLKAWEEMKRYNIHDVLSTEELYLKTRAWTPRTAPDVHLVGCGVCGGKLELRGTVRTKAGLFTKPHCTGCGIWPKGVKIKEIK